MRRIVGEVARVVREARQRLKPYQGYESSVRGIDEYEDCSGFYGQPSLIGAERCDRCKFAEHRARQSGEKKER